jgi:DegV family protein with EDD domain
MPRAARFVKEEDSMVKIITDSVSDLPPHIAEELDITVVPLNVLFGTEVYQDGVELNSKEFYHKLENCSILPTTSAPSPGTFAEAFDKVAEKTDEILTVVLSNKLSATYSAAIQGIQLMKRKCRVEVMTSNTAIMGQGLLVIETARKALGGASLDELMGFISENVSKTHIRATFDNLKYLAMGGRIGKAQALLGSMLKMNPILGLKDGEAFPFGKVRSRKKAIESLQEFVAQFEKVKSLAVEYGTNLSEAEELVKNISSIFPQVPLYLSNVSPVIGTHTGPSILSVSVLEE